MAAKEKLIIAIREHGMENVKRAMKDLDASTGKVGKSFAGLAAQIGLTVAAGMAMRKIIQVGADFESQMAKTKSVTFEQGKTLDQQKPKWDKLEKSARALGGSTLFTATQVAGLQTEYAKLGFTVPEIENVSKATLDLAQITGEDLSVAAETAGQTLRAFGLEASEMSRVTDVMATSFASSALDMTKFSYAMQYVAPVANAAGFSLEGVTGLLGTLAGVGIDGSMAGTALKKVLGQLADESSKLSDKLGGPIDNIDDLIPKLKEMKEDGMSVGEAFDLVGDRAGPALLALVENVDDIDELTIALEGAAGSGALMAEIQLDTFTAQMDLLGSASSELSLKLFDMVKGPLKGLIKGFSEWVQDIDPEEIEAYAKGVAFATTMLWLMTGGISKTTAALVKHRAALMATGWGAAAIGLGILAGAFLDWIDIFEDDTEEKTENIEKTKELILLEKEFDAAVKSLTNSYISMGIDPQAAIDILTTKISNQKAAITDLATKNKDLLDSEDSLRVKRNATNLQMMRHHTAGQFALEKAWKLKLDNIDADLISIEAIKNKIDRLTKLIEIENDSITQQQDRIKYHTVEFELLGRLAAMESAAQEASVASINKDAEAFMVRLKLADATTVYTQALKEDIKTMIENGATQAELDKHYEIHQDTLVTLTEQYKVFAEAKKLSNEQSERDAVMTLALTAGMSDLTDEQAKFIQGLIDLNMNQEQTTAAMEAWVAGGMDANFTFDSLAFTLSKVNELLGQDIPLSVNDLKAAFEDFGEWQQGTRFEWYESEVNLNEMSKEDYYKLLDARKKAMIKSGKDENAVDAWVTSKKRKMHYHAAKSALSSAASGLMAAARIHGKYEEDAKNLSAAMAIINTLESATMAAKSTPWPWNIAAVAGALAQGYAQVKQINAIDLHPPQVELVDFAEPTGGGDTGGSSPYQYGGYVGGRRHAQGGTMIEAEQGEFVMKRDAVKKMGLENMERINNLSYDISTAKTMWSVNSDVQHTVSRGIKKNRYQGGGIVRGGGSPSVVINISAPLVDDHVVDNLIPAIKSAIRRGELLVE